MICFFEKKLYKCTSNLCAQNKKTDADIHKSKTKRYLLDRIRNGSPDCFQIFLLLSLFCSLFFPFFSSQTISGDRVIMNGSICLDQSFGKEIHQTGVLFAKEERNWLSSFCTLIFFPGVDGSEAISNGSESGKLIF